MAFTQKLLSYSFGLEGGGSVEIPAGLRSTCKIAIPGPPTSGGQAEIAIYGMTLSQMNSLTKLATQQTNGIGNNEITVHAGDTNGMSSTYKGTVYTAWMDGRAMPEVCFRISALAGGWQEVMKSQPTSTKGSADVAQIAQKLAQKMGLSFENNNVSVKLSNPYLSGSYGTQMRELAEHAGIQWIIDKGTLAIWPTGKSRKGGPALISKDTGMVSYPAFNAAGVIVTCLFNPAIQYAQEIQIQSDITAANGTWTVYFQNYDLESITPHGPWFLELMANRGGTEPSGDQG